RGKSTSLWYYHGVQHTMIDLRISRRQHKQPTPSNTDGSVAISRGRGRAFDIAAGRHALCPRESRSTIDKTPGASLQRGEMGAACHARTYTGAGSEHIISA